MLPKFTEGGGERVLASHAALRNYAPTWCVSPKQNSSFWAAAEAEASASGSSSTEVIVSSRVSSTSSLEACSQRWSRLPARLV